MVARSEWQIGGSVEPPCVFQMWYKLNRLILVTLANERALAERPPPHARTRTRMYTRTYPGATDFATMDLFSYFRYIMYPTKNQSI